MCDVGVLIYSKPRADLVKSFGCRCLFAAHLSALRRHGCSFTEHRGTVVVPRCAAIVHRRPIIDDRASAAVYACLLGRAAFVARQLRWVRAEAED